MANPRAVGGREVSDEMIARWDEMAERGEFVGKPGKLVVHKENGRPRLFDEGTGVIGFRAPQSKIDEIRSQAERDGQSVSDYMRSLIDLGLAAKRERLQSA